MSKPSAHPPVVAVRCLVLLAAVAGCGAGLLEVAGPALVRVYDAGSVPFEVALEALCAAVTMLCWAWLQLSAVLVAAAAVAGACRAHRCAAVAGRASGRAVPDVLRRLLLGACGIALSAGPVVLPASAATRSTPDTLPATRAVERIAPDLDGLALPDRQPGTVVEPPRWVTVRPGDSLWAIARRLLPTGADDHQISAAWQRIAAANRPVLGDHPDLIHPGTRLRVPAHRRDGL